MVRFDIPQRARPGPASFDTRPAQVRAWLAALPTANLGETCRQLYGALRDVNRLDIPSSQRFRFLESVRPVLTTALEAMARHYVGRTFPLPEKSRKVAQLAQALNRELSVGYILVVDDEGHRGRLRRDGRMLAVSTHRALRSLGQLLLTAYRVYAPYPPGIWHQLHALYGSAETQGLTNSRVRDETYTGIRQARVADAYKQALLLALACPYRLRQGEAEQVHQALEVWAPRARLARVADEPQNPSGVFVADLAGDDAPSYLALRPGGYQGDRCRLLDTAELADTVRGELTRGPGGGAAGTRRLPEAVLRRLMLAWGVMPKRRFPRTRKHSTVMVATGLSAAHFFISGEIAFVPPDQAGGEEPVFDRPARFKVRPTTAERQHTPDVWDLYARPPEPPSATGDEVMETADHDDGSVTYQADTWKMINVSAGGYCLLWDSAESSGAQVGELVAIREVDEPDAFHWRLGVVRWMKCVEREGLQLGVQMIAPGAVGVGIKLKRTDGTCGDYMRGLLLPEIRALGQPASLLTPALPYRVNETVLVFSHGTEKPVRLTGLVENTGTFAQFHFMPQAGPAAGSRPSDPTDFDGLWESI